MVSVVIPVYNEADCLDELIRRCLIACEAMNRPFEVVLVNDGSTDSSEAKIVAASESHPGRIVGVLLNRNYGQHSAVIAGLTDARGDIIVTLDADLQNPPEEIPRLVAKIEEGYDVVGTVRVPRCDTVLRKVASYMVNRVAQKSTGVKMHDYGCMLRAYRRQVVDSILQCQERSTFIPILANSFASRTTEIEVGHMARTKGDSKYSIWQLISLQFDLLTSMTTFPLRLLSIIGTCIAASGVGLGIYILSRRLMPDGDSWTERGIFTLFAVLFIFVGAQFVAMGLLGEYIGRIYHDVRARPRYFVQKVVGRK